MNGLDDLRGTLGDSSYNQPCSRIVDLGWTLRGEIQQFIDVYVSRATFTEVERSFPYMVAREFASGGGDVRESSKRLRSACSRFASHPDSRI
jgi:hypothetical protein